MHDVLYEPARGQRVPIYLWTRAASPAALRQLQRIASMPYVRDHVAAMPDLHVAEGVAVGTVFATEDTVVPGALGGDLGCGMIAQRLAFPAAAADRRALERVLTQLGRAVPVGDATHAGRRDPLPDALAAPELSTRTLARARDALGPRHLGTLGGGNHFLELDRDADGDLWVVVHTGSRGMGAVVAAHHARAADTSRDALAGLSLGLPTGRAYLADLAWALRFARANRAAVLARALEVLATELGAEPAEAPPIDVHHNFAAREEHGGRWLVVHRKGATPAPEGALGLVPGSMGTATYVVRGLGAADSFGSCAHGAGRVLTRREARATIRPAALQAAMKRVVYDERRLRDLVEEAPMAYRPIAAVLEEQRDLVTPVLRLEPVAVLKG